MIGDYFFLDNWLYFGITFKLFIQVLLFGNATSFKMSFYIKVF